jgi:hypothetical protein
MERPDFSATNIVITLPQRVKIVNPKTQEVSNIVKVKLQRVLAPGLSRIKKTLSTIPKAMESSSYYIYVQALLKESISEFLNEDDEPVKVSSPEYPINKMTITSAYKAMIYSVMHLKEASFTTTAYKCVRCEGTNMFDIDPTQPIPEDVEPGRRLMEDYLDFTTEVADPAGLDSFIHTVIKDKPKIKVKDSSGSSEPGERIGFGKEEEVSIIEFRYPTLGDFIDASKKVDSELTADLLALFYSIKVINNYSEEETKIIKQFNHPKNVMAFRREDIAAMDKEVSRFGITNTHFFECEFCGKENHQPFDMTNFFEYLRN